MQHFSASEDILKLCTVAFVSLPHDSHLSARRSPQTSIYLTDSFSMEAGMK